MMDKLLSKVFGAVIPWWVYPAIAAALIAVGTGIGWTINGWRLNHTIDTMKLENAESVRKFQEDARKQENEWTNKLEKANEKAAEREKIARADANNARSSEQRLRNKIDKDRRELPGLAKNACVERADRYADLFGACVGRYRELGEEADRHVRDKAIMADVWPAYIKGAAYGQ